MQIGPGVASQSEEKLKLVQKVGLDQTTAVGLKDPPTGLGHVPGEGKNRYLLPNILHIYIANYVE